MKDSVLISIKPKWCNLIFKEQKTIEIRKTYPKMKPPFKCYVYCTEPNTKDPWKLLEIHSPDGKIHKGNGKVIGEFVCDDISIHLYGSLSTQWLMKEGCVTGKELCEYGNNGHKFLYAWHISDLKLYDEPKELTEFGFTRPPQSWCYTEEIKERPTLNTEMNLFG